MARPGPPRTPQPTAPVRAFGAAPVDLELDFTSPDRPGVVTALLAACAAPPAAEHWWRRTVGQRIAALLGVLQRAEAGEQLKRTLHCTSANCGQRFEIDLPYAALTSSAPADGAPDAEPSIELQRSGGQPLRLRLPTGEDLRQWRSAKPADREQALQAMLATLCSAGTPTLQDAQQAALALAEADPLVAFTVWCSCPACGAQAEHEIDLEGLALQRLAARQHALLRDVHQLASRYGWTEREVLEVAPARRAHYIALIEDEA